MLVRISCQPEESYLAKVLTRFMMYEFPGGGGWRIVWSQTAAVNRLHTTLTKYSTENITENTVETPVTFSRKDTTKWTI